jgi:hypothetical protein
MSPFRSAVSVLLSCFLSLSLAAQQLDTKTAQKDPSAMAILRQSIAAMGGGNLPQVLDLTLDGEVSEQKAAKINSGSIQVKMIGKDLCKVQIRDEDGESLHIVNGTRIRRVHDGEDLVMPLHASMNHHLQYVPILSSLLAIDDTDLAVKFMDEDSVDGRSVYHVHMERTYPLQSAENAHLLAKLTSTDFFIDKENFLLVMRAQQLPSLGDANNTLPIEFHYSDYRANHGILIPYFTSVRVNHQEHLQIHINSVATNSGIKAEEFEVPQ